MRVFSEITVEQQLYKQMWSMPAKNQFHVYRRLGPLMEAFAQMMGSRAKAESVIEALTPLARELARLSDEECNYIFDECLSLVHTKRGSVWQPIWDKTTHSLMHEDISLSAMLILTVNVIQESLASFIPGLNLGSLVGTGAPITSQ